MAKKRGKIAGFISNLFTDASKLFWRILTIVVSVFTLFIIGSSVWSIILSKIEISRLEKEKAEYLQSIQQDSLLLEELKYNEHLEKFAREHYNMHRKDEKVYIIK